MRVLQWTHLRCTLKLKLSSTKNIKIIIILQKCVTALEKTWHMEHFFCAQCGKQFGEEGFHEREGKPYCRDDYFDMFAPKCGACNRAIMENYISALNAQWHPDCFVCRVRFFLNNFDYRCYKKMQGTTKKRTKDALQNVNLLSK